MCSVLGPGVLVWYGKVVLAVVEALAVVDEVVVVVVVVVLIF